MFESRHESSTLAYIKQIVSDDVALYSSNIKNNPDSLPYVLIKDDGYTVCRDVDRPLLCYSLQ